MASLLHHDVGRDAKGQGVDDEGAAAGMGTDEFPLGLDLVGADVALVGGDADLLIDTGEFAQLIDVADASDFLLGEIDDLPLRHLQGWVELLIVNSS